MGKKLNINVESKNIKTDNIYEMYGLSLEEVSFIENM